jgi:hypothetical protein
MRSSAPRHSSYVVVAFLAALLVGWATPQAHAQVPDLDDVQVPDPGDVELPELDDVVPDLDDVVDPGDIDVPDIDEVIPDPGDVELPDTGDGDTPVTDDPPPDDGKDGRGGDRGGVRAPVRGRGSGDRGGAGESDSSTFTDLAAVRAVGGSNLPLESLGRNPAAKAETERKGLGGLFAPLTFPLILMVAVGAFLALQDYFDRKDPKLALGPIGTRDRRLTFD